MSFSSEELDGLTKDDLLDVAEELGLDVSTAMTKAQIREAIDAAGQPEATAEAAVEPSEARAAFSRR